MDIGSAHSVAESFSTGERATCAVRLGRYTTVLESGPNAVALISHRRRLILKDNLFGRPRINAGFPLAEIGSTGCGRLMGVDPTCTVDFVPRRKDPVQLYFLKPE